MDEVHDELAALTPTSIVAPSALADEPMGALCCAAMWLRFDFLEQSHRISQEIDSASGSYWHGILHRREPDYGNAKYWFRRVGLHPIYARLAEGAQQAAAECRPTRDSAFLANAQAWDPLKFVDLCEEALDGVPPIHNLCMRIQRLEWELLFDFCYRQAVAGG